MTFMAIIMITLGSIISLLNWMTLYESRRTKKFVSSVPIFGALCLGLGLASFEKSRSYAFLCVVVDYGTLVFIISIPSLVKQFWEISRFNLLDTFVAHTMHTEYKLKLYKKGIFAIEAEVKPPQIIDERGTKVSHFGFQGKWEDKEGTIQLTEFQDDRTVKLTRTGDRYLATEFDYPQDKEFSYDSLNEIEFVLVNE